MNPFKWITRLTLKMVVVESKVDRAIQCVVCDVLKILWKKLYQWKKPSSSKVVACFPRESQFLFCGINWYTTDSNNKGLWIYPHMYLFNRYNLESKEEWSISAAGIRQIEKATIRLIMVIIVGCSSVMECMTGKVEKSFFVWLFFVWPIRKSSNNVIPSLVVTILKRSICIIYSVSSSSTGHATLNVCEICSKTETAVSWSHSNT